MNINNYLPNHINLDEAKEKAVSYSGTFAELKGLYESGAVTLLTNGSQEVVGIWVNSGTGDLLVDELSGQNFAMAYRNNPVMEWIDCIITGVEPEALTPAESLPTNESINYDELDSVDEAGVKSYLRNKYGYYLSGFEEPVIEFDDIDAVAKVSDIKWGRKKY